MIFVKNTSETDDFSLSVSKKPLFIPVILKKSVRVIPLYSMNCKILSFVITKNIVQYFVFTKNIVLLSSKKTQLTMSKDTKKRNKYNQYIVKHLTQKYKVSVSMVRKSLSQARNSPKAKEILQEYERISLTLDSITEVVINKV